MRKQHLKSRGLALALAAGLLTVPALALANPTYYHTTFTTLNDSGVTGNANLMLDGDMLTVHINASGLQPGMGHAQHIHGTFSDGMTGSNTDATTPTMAQDANGDGFIELGEGQTTYGPILVPLFGSDGSFPTAPDGTIDFTNTYDLTDSSVYQSPLSRDGTVESDLMPLDFREIVLHGMNAPVDITDNANGNSYAMGEYDPVFPVASGEIVANAMAVPEPSTIFDMLAGLGVGLALVGFGRHRVRVKAH
jgi:hypothetical protein